MLIVEGSDLVGKTTFIKALLKELENRGYAAIPQHFGLLPKCWNYFLDYLPFINHRVVMDRFIMSEVVYGSTLRGCSRIAPSIYKSLDASLKKAASITVVLAGEPCWFADHVEHEHPFRDEVFTPQQIIDVNKAFVSIIDTTGRYHEYTMNVDYGYVKYGNDDWPSDNRELVTSIVDDYLRQLAAAGVSTWT
jgi:GTPase SAR1 family protein